MRKTKSISVLTLALLCAASSGCDTTKDTPPPQPYAQTTHIILAGQPQTNQYKLNEDFELEDGLTPWDAINCIKAAVSKRFEYVGGYDNRSQNVEGSEKSDSFRGTISETQTAKSQKYAVLHLSREHPSIVIARTIPGVRVTKDYKWAVAYSVYNGYVCRIAKTPNADLAFNKVMSKSESDARRYVDSEEIRQAIYEIDEDIKLQMREFAVAVNNRRIPPSPAKSPAK